MVAGALGVDLISILARHMVKEEKAEAEVEAG
jgi:hypothetical protein